MSDLIRLANEKLSDELNWILRCVDDMRSIDYTLLSKSIGKSIKRSYFEVNDKKGVIDSVMNMFKPETYNQFIIDKVMEILQILLE